MTNVGDETLLTLPPRILTDGERELLREWAAAAANTLSAYLSQRRADDPATYRRIVIRGRDTRQPLYLVFCPAGMSFWVMISVATRSEVGRFPTLRAALNCVKPVLAT